MILKTARKGRKRKFTKTKSKNSEKTHHISPFRASRGVSPLSSLQRIYSEISRVHCTLCWKTENHRETDHAIAIGIRARRERWQIRHLSKCPASWDFQPRIIQDNIQDLLNYRDLSQPVTENRWISKLLCHGYVFERWWRDRAPEEASLRCQAAGKMWCPLLLFYF